MPPPQPVQPAPQVSDPAVEEARRRELVMAGKQKGRSATLLTGGEGVQPGNIGTKSLLGG